MSEPSIAWNTGDRAIRINLCTLNKNNTFTFYLSGLLFKNALSGSTCAPWTWKNTFTFLLVSYMSYQECTQHSKTPTLGGLFIKDTHSHPLTWSPCPCSRWWGRCWPRPPWPWPGHSAATRRSSSSPEKVAPSKELLSAQSIWFHHSRKFLTKQRTPYLTIEGNDMKSRLRSRSVNFCGNTEVMQVDKLMWGQLCLFLSVA